MRDLAKLSQKMCSIFAAVEQKIKHTGGDSPEKMRSASMLSLPRIPALPANDSTGWPARLVPPNLA